MPEEDLTASLIECFSNAGVVGALRGLLTPIVSEAVETDVAVAVAAAVASKDAEIKQLKETFSKELKNLKSQLNDNEQYSRRQCVNISGIPEHSNEDAKKIVLELSRITGAQVEPADVDVAHRIGRPKPGKTRTIIARFVTVSKRQAFYAERRGLRGARAPPGSQFTGDTLQQTYISDNLTQQNEQLMYQARQLKKKGKLFAAWSDQGKLKVKENLGASTKIFKTADDLRALCGDDPVLDEEPAPAAAAAAARQPEDAVDPEGFRKVNSRRGRSASKK